MPGTIPVEPSVPDQQFTTTLTGIVYDIRVRWNTRDESWYMDVRDKAGVAIQLGIRLVLGSTLGLASGNPLRPEGRFILIDTSGENREATLDDLGTRVVLQFESWAEMNATLSAVEAVELALLGSS